MVRASNDNEARRLEAVRALDILDTPAEESFDRFARLAAGLFAVPIARVSIIDADREFLKATLGCERETIEREKSFCTWTVGQDAPLVIPDLALDPRFRDNPRVVGGPRYRFYAGAQLRNRDGLNLGALCCLDVAPRVPSPRQVSLLQDLAQLAVEALELRRVAMTDSLTGAMSRRAFGETAVREIARATRGGHALCCLMLDLDHFKSVNDTHGHAAGDEVLRRIAGVCRRVLRTSDTFGRLGGEEFVALLPDTAAAGGLEAAERLRVAIAAEAFGDGGAPWRVTASLGLAELRPGADLSGLLATADAALYAAKRAGRNRTLSAETLAASPDRVAAVG